MQEVVNLVNAIKVLFLAFTVVHGQYEVGDVRVEALAPRGLRVSIEDEEGISLFAFHGKINEEMHGREGGTFSVDIWKPKDGRWTYLTKGPKLKIGDVINYWVQVYFDDGNSKLGYFKDDQHFVVKELIPSDRATTTTTTTTTTTQRTAPPPTQVFPIGTDMQCKISETIVQNQQRCQGELIFYEEFINLLETKWRPEIRFAGDPDYEFVIYQNSKENIYIENGKLYIKPTVVEEKLGKNYVRSSTSLDLGESCTGIPGTEECVQQARAWKILPPVFSGQISTIDYFSFKYGVIEIRARLPKGDWIYPELYLKSKNEDYGYGLESGLIKIAYSPGNELPNKTLHGGCILGESVAARNYGIRTTKWEKLWNNVIHVFRLEWKPDRITLKINNQIYGTINPPDKGFAAEEQQLGLKEDVAKRWRSGSELAPFDKEMYIVLGVGVGGFTFSTQENVEKPWNDDDPKRQLNFYKATSTWRKTWDEDSKLIIDSVKVWAL